MRHTVTLATPSAMDAYGDPTYGAQRTIQAQVANTVKRRALATSGSMIEDVSVCRVLTYDPVYVGDRMWLPGADATDANAAQTVRQVTPRLSTVDGRTLYEVEA